MANLFVRKAQRYIVRCRMWLILLHIGYPARSAWALSGEIVAALRGTA